MIRKLIKSGIAIVLSLSLAMIPNSFAAAKTITDTVYSSAVIDPSTSDLPTEAATKYADTAKLAGMKASLLTSIYGETSVQYALIDNGEIVISGQSGVYSRQNDTALTNTHMYGIGSVSKMFATAAIMQLVDQGKIKLDTPVVKYLPKFKMADARYKDITVRMLLNHSSGLLGSTFHNTMLFEDNDNSGYLNLLEELKTARLKADPGEFSVYCNDGFSLAEMVVEAVSGMTFTEFISNNISAPLGLNNTKTPMDDFSRDNLVKTYGSDMKNTLPTEYVNVIGAGGIYSTAEDLCHFAEIFMHNSKAQVLSLESAKAMEKPEYLNGLWSPEVDTSLSYGLGWDSVSTYPFTQYGIKALVKGGDTSLFHGSLIVLPEEGMAMAVLSSGGASIYDQVMAQEILLSALLAKGTISEIKPNKTNVIPVKVDMPSSQKKNEGYYTLAGTVLKITIREDGNLTLSDLLSPASAPQKFTYSGDGKFYYSDGSVYVSFVKGSNGITYLNVAGYSMLPNIGQIANAGYQAQKISVNSLSQKVKAAWEKRDNKNYFIINEKYSSELYAFGSPAIKITLLKDLGLCMNATIIDKNTAQTLVQIPGMHGRDLSDYTFYPVGKTEYLKTGSSILIPEDAMKSLSAKSTFSCTIGKDGYAQWYKINKKLGDKKIKVTLPKKSSYTIYDANGTNVFNSLTMAQTSVTLPSDGYIVFVGSANAKFTVRYVK
jgi:CubicO group peptidase (beta-lactamase class C family)